MSIDRHRRAARTSWFWSVPALLAVLGRGAAAADPWLVFEGTEGPGSGKHVVLISGDEEYRSEEALPQLGKILAKRHGFRCTVLFAIDPDTGVINPDRNDNIPGLEALARADLMIIATRFRNLPDEQMRHIAEYVESGRPVIGMRTATHAFQLADGSHYARYSWRNAEWDGGFGRQVLGETWISHHGQHGRQSTRGLIARGAADHPIAKGLRDGDVWGPTDVYGVRLPLPGDSRPILLGEVVEGMRSTDRRLEGEKNDPMMPIAWVKTYASPSGKTARVFTTTLGASQDLQSAGVRRMLVNAAYWAVGLESRITDTLDVELVGAYDPTPFGFKGYRKGLKPMESTRDR